MTIISQGAEATITLKDGKIFKSRISKSYRNNILDDKLRSSRTKIEKKVIEKLNSLGINVPKFFGIENKYDLVIEFIEGERLRDALSKNTENKKYLNLVGEWLAIMHNEGIIHGDLTTSNILLDKNKKIFLIDFGLSFFSKKIEDKAVDIHLLKQAIKSTHYQNVIEFYDEFVKGYNSETENPEVFERLKIVEKRGKNKG